jgi:hypothetical protein
VVIRRLVEKAVITAGSITAGRRLFYNSLLFRPACYERESVQQMPRSLQELVAEHTEREQVVSFATLVACGLSKKTPVPGTSQKSAGICDRFPGTGVITR